MTVRLADFYIIGAMKCATSTLHEQLARRGRFFMTTPKEPNFYNDGQRVAHELSGYAKLFEPARPEQICGESSTHYTKIPTYEGTAERIFEYTPNARFVYVMRDPLDRIASQYIHEWTQREVTGSFSQAVEKHERYTGYSSYARQLRPYLSLFGQERVLPVFFEHLTLNPTAELERVARFLGDDSTERFEWHEEAERANVSQDRLRKSSLRTGILSLPLARKLKDVLPASARERIKSFWRIEKRPTLSSRARELALRTLDPDMAELGSLLGLPLSCANFAEIARQTQAEWSR